MNKHRFLLIETSTEACSVALSEGDTLLAQRSIKEPKAHARLLAPFVTEVLAEAKLSLSDCDAIAVSEGPGSYTGLRVGVSTAKGLCYGSQLPLIGIGTLHILAEAALQHLASENIDPTQTSIRILPMIDARRMEVYTAAFDGQGQALEEAHPVILNEESFAEDFANVDCLVFIGDGVRKFKEILPQDLQAKARWYEECPDAAAMIRPTEAAFTKKEFKDVAYFEPFYLKDFVAGVSRKSLL